MPALETEVIGYCPFCKVRIVVDADLILPWHAVLGAKCGGVGKKAVDVDSAEATTGKRKRK